MSTFPQWFLVILIIIFGALCFISGSDNAYTHGQIDALTGKVKYELVVKPDSTRVWQRIKQLTAR